MRNETEAINRQDSLMKSNFKGFRMIVENREGSPSTLKRLWADPEFRAKVQAAQEKARATRRARAAERQQRKAAEVQARREAREARRNERERERRFKRERREAAQAARMARINAPVPRIEEAEAAIPSWAEIRLQRVTVQENGQVRRRTWAELGDEENA